MTYVTAVRRPFVIMINSYVFYCRSAQQGNPVGIEMKIIRLVFKPLDRGCAHPSLRLGIVLFWTADNRLQLYRNHAGRALYNNPDNLCMSHQQIIVVGCLSHRYPLQDLHSKRFGGAGLRHPAPMNNVSDGFVNSGIGPTKPHQHIVVHMRSG